MSEHLAPEEADRLRQAESRWLEQARERLRRPTGRPYPSTHARPGIRPEVRPEETDR